MVEALPETITLGRELQLAILGTIAILLSIVSYVAFPWVRRLFGTMMPEQIGSVYQKIVQPYETLAGVVGVLAIAEFLTRLLDQQKTFDLLEIPVSLALIVSASWLASRLFRQFFDVYWLEITIKSGRKVNSELLILAKIAVNLLILILAVIIFAQTHNVNVFGLVASLGIGGLAVAFAAQKTLEQVLGGIVIYLDKPFVVDDYIGLPDSTFGRVESIGLRSTKIRTSGKGTLVVVPNNMITQVAIENYSGAKKVMALIYLNFHGIVPRSDRALVQQIIVNSTSDIFGIDSNNTDIAFKDYLEASEHTKVQITFFILGSGNVSMGLRRQVLDIASQNITHQLREYHFDFDIEEPTIYVDAPITV